MAVPDDDGLLIVVHRAIGKLSDPASGGPTYSTDCVELDEALRIGRVHVAEGTWTEFYVKTIHRRRAVART